MRRFLLQAAVLLASAALLAALGAWAGVRVAQRAGMPARDGAEAGIAAIGFLIIVLSGSTRTGNFERRLRYHTLMVGGTIEQDLWARDREQRRRFSGSMGIVGLICWGFAAILYLMPG